MEEIDLKELLLLFWNKKIKILLIVAIFIAIGIIYTIGLLTPKYTSSTTLVLATEETKTSSDRITTSDITLNSNLVPTYSEIAKSKNVVRQVISNLGIDIKENELKRNIAVSSVKNTELIQISVTDKNSADAAKIANEMAKVFSERVTELYNINNIHVLDEAEIEKEPSNVNHTKDIVVFTFIGLVVAILYVLVLNMLDNTIKTSEEVEKQFKVPVLASIPMYSFDLERGGKRR